MLPPANPRANLIKAQNNLQVKCTIHAKDGFLLMWLNQLSFLNITLKNNSTRKKNIYILKIKFEQQHDRPGQSKETLTPYVVAKTKDENQ